MTLLHQWKFDGSLGDSAGTADFTDPGGLSYVTGQVGRGVSVPGSSAVTGPNAATANFGAADNFTVAFWFRQPAGGGSANYAFRKKDTTGTNAGWIFYTLGTGPNQQPVFGVGDGAIPTVVAAGGAEDLAANQWTHLAGVVDRTADTVKLYVNGSVVASSDISSVGSLSTTEPLMLGRASDTDVRQYDEARIYNEALGADAVLALASAANGASAVSTVLHSRRARGC